MSVTINGRVELVRNTLESFITYPDIHKSHSFFSSEAVFMAETF